MLILKVLFQVPRFQVLGTLAGTCVKRFQGIILGTGPETGTD